MSTNISTIEDFPSLPTVTKTVKTAKKSEKQRAATKRSRSALSSESIGDLEEIKCPKCTHELAKGTYYVARDDVFLRPFLNCHCVSCWDKRSESSTIVFIREQDWNGCEKKRLLEKGLLCEVSKSKVVYHRADRKHRSVENFSVAYVEIQGSKLKRGWVPSRFLKQRTTLRSESVLSWKEVESKEHMDRSRANSVCSFETSAPQPLFQLREIVRVRIETGAWEDGEVQSVEPHLLILLNCDSRAYYYDVADVQKYPVREFVALKDVAIRADEAIDRWTPIIGTLKKGSSVSIAYWKGTEARITAPMPGWISMRTKHTLNVLEKDYTFVECNPSVLVYVPGDMTEMDLIALFQQVACVTPERITFQAKNGKFRAIVEITGYKTGMNIVDLGGASFTNGESFSFSWYLPYLKSRAYTIMTN